MTDTGKKSKDAALVSETLARLYEEQGDITRASTIREKLMRRRQWNITVGPAQPGPPTADAVIAQKTGESTVQCRWEMTPQAVGTVKSRFPSALKEHSKALTAVLRVVLIRAAGPEPVRDYQDVEIPDMAGTCSIRGIEQAQGWLCAAVGLKHASGRFHSIAHSAVIHLP